MLKCIGGLVWLCLTQIAWAQLQLTTVRGTALGPDGQPVPEATVRLLDPLGNAVASTTTDALGIFLFQGVAPGTYSLQAETAQLRSPARRLTVNSALPIETEIRLATRLDEKLIVTDSELDELMERPGSDLVNFDRGRVKPRTLFDVMVGRTLVRRDRLEVSARLEILNLTNQAYALNFGNPFSGTHFGAPLTVALKLRFNLR